jgi:hypothetical protein
MRIERRIHGRFSSRLSRLLYCAAAFAVLGGGCGGNNGKDHGAAPTQTAAATGTAPHHRPATGAGPLPPPPESSGRPPRTPLEQRAAGVVREYVEAIDRRDAQRLCHLIAPDVLRRLALSGRARGCVASLRASIGRDRGGRRSEWRGVRVASAPAVAAIGGSIRVTLTIAERFARKPPVSIEDDVVYLVHRGGRTLVAQPSLALYRAVGVSDVPPAALAPPR